MKDSLSNWLKRIIRIIRWKPEEYTGNSIQIVIITAIILYYWYTSPVLYTFKSQFFHMLPSVFIISIVGTFFTVYRIFRCNMFD